MALPDEDIPVAPHRPDLPAAVLDALPERVSRYRLEGRVIVHCNAAWAAGHGTTPRHCIGPRWTNCSPHPNCVVCTSSWLGSGPAPGCSPIPSRARHPTTPPGGSNGSIGWPRVPTATRCCRWGATSRTGTWHSSGPGSPSSGSGWRWTGPRSAWGSSGSMIVSWRSTGAFCAFLGRSADDLVGRRWQEITHPEDIDPDQALIDRMTVEGDPELLPGEALPPYGWIDPVGPADGRVRQGDARRAALWDRPDRRHHRPQAGRSRHLVGRHLRDPGILRRESTHVRRGDGARPSGGSQGHRTRHRRLPRRRDAVGPGTRHRYPDRTAAVGAIRGRGTPGRRRLRDARP